MSMAKNNETPSNNLKIKDLSPTERPRERLIRSGVESLSNAELLAVLLRTGTKGNSVLQMASQLLRTFSGQLNHLLEASLEEICQVSGIGESKAMTLFAAFELVRRARKEKLLARRLILTCDDIVELMRECYAGESREILKLLLLNARHGLIQIENISEGSLREVKIDVSEIFRRAILAKASSIVLVHNHPTGNPEPSPTDISVTRDVARAGQIMRIDLFDHIIIGKHSTDRENDYTSLRKLGYINR